MRRFLVLFLAVWAVAPALAWEHWGGDAGGLRFSPLAQITPDNVGNLVRAWEFRTGDLDSRTPAVMKRTKFQATPLLVEDSLIFCSPFNEVIALDPGSGAQKWRYDPKINTSQPMANRYNCRGVAYWVDREAAESAVCRARIFIGTNGPNRSHPTLVERDADAPVVAPDRTAAADELIGLDHQHEGRRQADGADQFDRRTARRQIAHGAGEAIAIVGDAGALQHPVSPRYPLLVGVFVHRRPLSAGRVTA
jgi:hypothetical protein